MSRLYINPTIEKQIISYCKLNNINDVNAFANRCALQGLNIVKYGTSPSNNMKRESEGIKDVNKEELKNIETNKEIESKNINNKPKETKIRIIKKN
jgi:hypothetical protein